MNKFLPLAAFVRFMIIGAATSFLSHYVIPVRLGAYLLIAAWSITVFVKGQRIAHDDNEELWLSMWAILGISIGIGGEHGAFTKNTNLLL